MHLRPKPWARPELEACGFFQATPPVHRGQWHHLFKKKQPLHIELGCGKGTFIAELASRHPETNYLAIDLIDAVLGLTKRNIQAAYADKNQAIDNVQIMSWDIERIDMILAPEDGVERIYINFCNPWPRRRFHKKRLTHTKQLEKYKKLLAENGEIHFKTDSDDLFRDSIKYLESAGFTITTLINDLHAADYSDNIETEHERMFSDQGIKIKFLIASLT
ncbi:tRNA (guanosine(46)-N7)-methyltransferase TrmB [Acetobacterium wieringae]|jgi:tRNA (guanine-N7-)-methyltransferase|uniref:tRNA (guanine-N(7)-)-methyltransferase n=1 Tax=Acetobacterium wieringae TaxID=52694 RepID=A0ABY6HFQ4_9FIRM|nr:MULTISPECIES: tRNA (guanosine(46)-N7)-methyltransferase TrmB [Acetobacterium]UYO63135.1 tRNA (guanosine(46)-N7)-methyltransferase TrmB [Acetobacterium wieringae]VUZ25799.1 tRNA (guanine-N(7)-)-methyltransferase [Acetobacterium wieringae]